MNTIKKLIVATAILASVVNINATEPAFSINSEQDTIEHLKFMGIEIDGNPDAFCKALEDKGFSTDPYTDKGTKTMTGRFAGHDDCTIFVRFDPELNLVTRVSVAIKATKTSYELTVDDLKNKYSGAEHSSLTSNSNTFDLPQGYIAADYITVGSDNVIMLIYHDKQNHEKSHKRSTEDL